VAPSIFNAVVSEEVNAVAQFLVRADFVANIQEGIVAADQILARFLWELINDTQPADWDTINDSQTASWGAINTAQVSTWNTIDASQNTTWGLVDDGSDATWNGIPTIT
jgi:hypothetical protein